MVWAAVSTGFLFAQSALFEHFGGSTLVASVPDLVDEQHDAALVGGTRFLLLVVTGVIWLVWWAKAHAAASVRRDVRAGRGWAIGSWFVPFANLVVPKRVADDLWTAACEPERPRDAGVVRSGLVLGWWIAWLASTIFAFSISGNGKTVSDAANENAVQILQQVLVIVAAALAFRVVRTITAGFEAQAGADVPERRVGFRTLVVAGTVVVLVVTAVGCRHLFDVVPDRGASAQATSELDGDVPAEFAAPGSPFSLQVPNGWSVTDRSKLTDPVVFDAGRPDLTGVIVIEMPNTGPMDWDSFADTLDEQNDVVGDITQTTVELPGGHATCFALTTVDFDGAQFDHRFYLFEGQVSVFMVTVTAPQRDVRLAGRGVRRHRGVVPDGG